MSMSRLDHALMRAVAERIRAVAATEIMPRWRNLGAGDIREKTPGDWVTAADLAAETALRASLSALLGGCATVGEEEAAADPAVLERLSSSGIVWLIDPVDGTAAFKAGEAGFGTLVAMVVDGSTQMGWLYDCVADRLLAAIRGAGAWEVDRHGYVTHMPAAGTATAPGRLNAKRFRADFPWPPAGGELLAREGIALEPIRHGVVEYQEIAMGTVSFRLDSATHPWDHAAGALLVTEQGGVAEHFDGTPYSPRRTDGGVMIARNEAGAAAARIGLLAAAPAALLASPRRTA